MLRRAGEVTGAFELRTRDFPWSCEFYLQTGRMMPEDGLTQLADADAIYLGAVGYPGVADHVSLWGLLLPIRQGFDQYVNLRPVQVLDGIPSPLRDKGPAEVDMLCIRENTEGEYAGLGGRFHVGRPEESAVQTSMFTRRGVERIARYAFDRARERRRALASATKSNALQYTAVMWDEIVAEVGWRLPRSAAHVVPRRRSGGAHGHGARNPRRDRRQQPIRRHPHRPRRRTTGLAGFASVGQPQSRKGSSVHVRAGPRFGTASCRVRASPTPWPPSGRGR